jgi:DNA-binding response OmpR family regulator/DNA-binding CsgD family transcriptional regulator
MKNPISEPAPTTLPPAKPENQRVILVVDDALDTLRMLCDALMEENYIVLVAQDAKEALARLDVVVPDGILLDAVMPGMDGFELCQRIKATPAWAHVPIVFMTGLSDTEQIVRGFAVGGVDYVVKPLSIPEVLARLNVHVRNARAARLAREAVDVAGLGTLLLDRHGRIAWRSPQAAAWLAQAFGSDAGPGSETTTWLMQALADHEARVALSPQQTLIARHIGAAELGETMLLLQAVAQESQIDERLRNVSLTPRETEVLSWVAKGKTNRDIADILGMSPRTVNKHLEHVFEKLGIETRSAAAAIAGKLLPS